jgi:hypothetical protein
MPIPHGVTRHQAAEAGFQEHLRFDVVPAAEVQSLINTIVHDAGALDVEGIYEMHIETYGVDAVDVTLRPSAVSGAFAPSAIITLADGSTQKAAVAGANFAANTTQTLEVTGLLGERKVIVRFTVPAGGSVTFAIAEASGK